MGITPTLLGVLAQIAGPPPPVFIGFWLAGADTFINNIVGGAGTTLDRPYYGYTPHTTTNSPAGPLGAGYSLDGSTGNHLASRANSVYAAPTKITVGGFLRSLSGNQSPTVIVTNDEVNAVQPALFGLHGVANSVKMAIFTSGSWSYIGSAHAQPADTWVHYAMTLDTVANAMALYINGVLVDSQTYVGTAVIAANLGMVLTTGEGSPISAGYAQGLFLMSGIAGGALIASLAAGYVPSAP